MIIVADVSILFSSGLIPFADKIKIINSIQFAFRFNIIAMPLLTIVLTYSICSLAKKNYILLFLSICAYCVMNIISIGNTIMPYYYKDNLTLETLIPDLTGGRKIRDYAIIQGSEYLPIMDESGDFYYPDSLLLKLIKQNTDYEAIYIKKNNDSIPLSYNRKGTHIEFEYSAQGNELLMLPLTHYKGYKV